MFKCFESLAGLGYLSNHDPTTGSKAGVTGDPRTRHDLRSPRTTPSLRWFGLAYERRLSDNGDRAGGVAERFMALVLKTREGQPSRGSNPRPSATKAVPIDL